MVIIVIMVIMAIVAIMVIMVFVVILVDFYAPYHYHLAGSLFSKPALDPGPSLWQLSV
jgi:hypothetical protein